MYISDFKNIIVPGRKCEKNFRKMYLAQKYYAYTMRKI